MTRLLTASVLVAASLSPAPLSAVAVQDADTVGASFSEETRSRATASLLPDTVVAPPGGPRLVLLGTPGSGVAALRLHVPLPEGPAEAGVGRLLRELNLARMEGLARPVGARVSVTRTPWGLSYGVEGAVADFEYLAYLLREAVGRPDVDDVPFTRARQRLADDVARNRETPGGRLAAELRRLADPSVPLAEGTSGTLAALDPGRVLEAWRRSHQAEKMTLVVSAGLLPEVVLAATRDMGTPETADPGALDAPAPPAGPPSEIQSLRRWYGRVWTGGAPDSPLGPVAALLLSATLERGSGDWETTLQLRELPDRWALLVMGAAYPEEASAMRAAVDGVLAATRTGLDAEAVARASARVRRDLLYRARTPLGLVEVVGRALEATGEATAAARYLEALEELEPEAVRAFLDGLGEGRQAEVRP